MHRLLLLLFATSFPLILHPMGAWAQSQPPAPIERQTPVAPAADLPNAPQPAPVRPAPTQAQIHADRQWEQLARGTHYARPEVRIQAIGDPIRCDVDKVTPDEIFCTEHRAVNSPLGNLFHPREMYHVPRREIRDVRVGGRDISTILGIGIGVGIGVGLGSINDATRADGGQAILALLLGGLGGVIGHALPLAGHPIYQQP